ncbi:MAG: TonB C-terminal domain-containing protein [Betaproteobacteria bacterium]|nr:TonB C-terminal domain-containing protein [Betaproteobacteria bacterium]
MFEERAEPGQWLSLALAILVHVVLALVLVFGVRWQNRPPEAVRVELWEAPQAAPLPAVEPKPLPKVEPPAPSPAPKPEPRIEKPDIVEKAPPPKPKPKPVAKPEPLKPRVTEAEKQLKEAAALEQASLVLDRERQAIAEQLKREAAQASAAASARALEGWIARIRGKIRGNILLPEGIKGNPEAIFDVVQLPTGEVLSVKLRKSSGHGLYDQVVERAILKSSPLPRPDRPEQFRRELELKFRPLDAV